MDAETTHVGTLQGYLRVLQRIVEEGAANQSEDSLERLTVRVEALCERSRQLREKG